MAFSLSNWFKGKPDASSAESASETAVEGQETPAPVSAAPHPAVRTVTPNSQQPVSLRDPSARPPVSLISAVPPPASNGRVAPVLPPVRKVSFPIPATMPMASAQPSHAVPSMPAPVRVPAFASHAPVPVDAPDVAVILEIGDFLDRLPPGFANSGTIDRRRTVEFRAEELYADLTKGRASVPASVIYQKCPDIFARPITDEEDAEVALPLQKLVEQLSAALQTRQDQVAEDNVGEIETPFLQVAMEDSARLPRAAGTNAGAVRPVVRPMPAPPEIAPPEATDLPVRPAHRTGQISTITAPKVPLDPPLAPPSPTATGPINPGKRPPSTVRASVAGGKIRLSGPANVTRIAPAPGGAPSPQPGPPARPSTSSQRISLPMQPASPSHQVAKKTARIQIPPISLRQGGPGATPRPNAPTPPSVPVQPSPVTIRPPANSDAPISFRTTPPPATAKLPPPSFAPAPRPNVPPSFPATPPAAAPAATAAPDNRKIDLGLAAVLRAQPSSALAVEPSSIPDDVRFTLPFANVEKQLAQGRVTLGREAFLQALPEAYRQVLAEDETVSDIQIPLQEVFQNLPSNALNIREDQVVEETGSYYPTPFSQKADEDAQRFGTPAPSPAEAKVPQPKLDSALPPPEAVAPAVQEPAQSPVDPPLPVTEEPASSIEELALPPETTPEALDPMESAPVETGEQETVVGEETASSAPEAPAPSVVEPPMETTPTPVEEALAVLESTAPAKSDAVEETGPGGAATETVSDREEVSRELAPAVSAPEKSDASAAPSPAAARLAPLKAADSELQTLFMTEEELDAKSIVRLVSQLPGIRQCAIMFADGLHLAGNFSVGDTEAFSAMAPPFFKRTQNFVSELKIGNLQTFTLFTDKGLLSFFMHEDICVSVGHTGRGFLPGVREKMEIVTRELARMYSTAKPVELADPSI